MKRAIKKETIERIGDVMNMLSNAKKDSTMIRQFTREEVKEYKKLTSFLKIHFTNTREKEIISQLPTLYARINKKVNVFIFICWIGVPLTLSLLINLVDLGAEWKILAGVSLPAAFGVKYLIKKRSHENYTAVISGLGELYLLLRQNE